MSQPRWRTGRRLWAVGLFAAVALVAAYGSWWAARREPSGAELTLHGNVDLRQVELPFNNSERVAEVLVEEGTRVTRGQILARLDTSRLRPQLSQAEAQLAAQRAAVQRLHNGSRPEEIAQARANVVLAHADAGNAQQQYLRLQNLSDTSAGRGISRQDLDNAKTALEAAQARLAINQNALKLQVIGPRQEDIAQAEAELGADEARLELLRQQLADANLVAPVDGVVRSRLLEAGEMASPQHAAFALTVTDPKWVRAYVDEAELGKVRMGMPASVNVDAFPGQSFVGWVGFVSPVSEFTPKSVQTEELRTSLVYEVRVFVRDPLDKLPLGTPATVTLPLPVPAAAAAAGAVR
ncbi:efflux RND transporter periplasmic adaptor subunit [Nevskia soli]|uniref:efflux RND transporter periplasmic adaptor subunit n=1 Tax=Nevskia soli TaxID=418856 RepID=UPI00068D162D